MQIGSFRFDWIELLDITLVAILLYQVYNLVKGSIASRVFLGYLLVELFYLTVRYLKLEMLTAVMQYFLSVGAVALIVIFQQEIRRFLFMLGKSTAFSNNWLVNRFLGGPKTDLEADQLKTIADACRAIASDFNGAIIVIRKQDDLEKFIESGHALDAIISKPLLVSLFNQYSALHEGAVIVSNGRIAASRCILPVADGKELAASAGFRHRAAVGISETTDAVAVVLSEQTGRISLAVQGELLTNIPSAELEKRLSEYLNQD